MIKTKNFQDEYFLWEKAAKNIGVDLSNISDNSTRDIEYMNEIKFSLVYSPRRSERPDQTRIKDLSNLEENNTCNMCNELSRYLIKKDNALDDRRYQDYRLFPNLFPILPGHIVLIQPDHNKRNVTKEDLESMINLSNDRGYHIWHNMIGAGSTIPHDHFQGVPYNMPLEDLKIVHSNNDYTCKSHPGKSRVFDESKLNEAIKYMKRLDENNVPYTINITDKIFIFPIRFPQGKGGIGGFETALGSVSRDKDEYTSITGDKLYERLRRVLC
jgi:ATP adenylyltransferase/5',5'''-P-1,P-4-tetraphosphate phosphorylase II